MLLRIFYEKLNSAQMKEISSYGVGQLLSDFGGVLGVLLGFSVITLGEFVFLAVDIVLFALSQGRFSLF